MPIHIVSLCGEHEVAFFAAEAWPKFVSLGAPCLVLRHHRSVFLYCIGGAVSCSLGGARKSMAQQLQKAVWPRQSTHLKEIGAKRAQQQEPVRGFDARENDVGGHELRESSGIRDITAVRNSCCQSGALDHKGGAGIVGEQCEAVAPDLCFLRCVKLPGAVDKKERPDSWSKRLSTAQVAPANFK